MGIVYAKLKLLNAIDVGLFKRGMLEEDKIRQADVDAIVDSGASTIAVPTRLAVQLGLDHVRFTEAELANGQSEKVAGFVNASSSVFIVIPRKSVN